MEDGDARDGDGGSGRKIKMGVIRPERREGLASGWAYGWMDDGLPVLTLLLPSTGLL